MRLQACVIALLIRLWLQVENAVLEKCLVKIYTLPISTLEFTKIRKKKQQPATKKGVIIVKNVDKSSWNNRLVKHGDNQVCCWILSDFEKVAKQAKKSRNIDMVLSWSEQ